MQALRQLAKTGVNVPSVRDEPPILQCYQWLWGAFCALSERRMRIDFTPQPIPVSEVAAFADYTGITDEVRREQLLAIVTVLDRLYMDHHWQQVKKNADAAAAAARARRR